MYRRLLMWLILYEANMLFRFEKFNSCADGSAKVYPQNSSWIHLAIILNMTYQTKRNYAIILSSKMLGFKNPNFRKAGIVKRISNHTWNFVFDWIELFNSQVPDVPGIKAFFNFDDSAWKNIPFCQTLRIFLKILSVSQDHL